MFFNIYLTSTACGLHNLFCADGRHTFISVCADGLRSVINDKYSVFCFDVWHNYPIVLLFSEISERFSKSGV